MADLINDSQIRELVNDPARKCFIKKDTAYLPFIYVDPKNSPIDRQIIPANRKQLTFLYHLQSSLDLEESAKKADMTVEEAERFLDKPGIKAWLENKAEQAALISDWTPGKWFQLGQKFLDAPEEVEIPRAKIEVWKEFGDRVMPKVSRNSDREGSANVVINISGDAVREAFSRKAAIDAQIIGDAA
jgi:hypothetical protein